MARRSPWKTTGLADFSDNLGMKFQIVKIYCTALSLSLASLCTQVQAQAPAGAKPLLLPAGASAQKVNEFLATLRPATSFQALEVGNNLKLGTPDIAESGAVRVEMSSTLPRTDAMWLLTLAAQPEGGGPLFGAITLEPAAQPEASLVVKLYRTQHLMLVARSAGKYYAVHRHIKVGESASTGSTK